VEGGAYYGYCTGLYVYAAAPRIENVVVGIFVVLWCVVLYCGLLQARV